MAEMIVRLTDTSTHGGAVITAAAKWLCVGKPIARLTDLFSCPLHGVNPIVEGSGKYLCESLPIARHGDHTACGAALIAGQARWDCA